MPSHKDDYIAYRMKTAEEEQLLRLMEWKKSEPQKETVDRLFEHNETPIRNYESTIDFVLKSTQEGPACRTEPR
jgi:hypothetical protein